MDKYTFDYDMHRASATFLVDRDRFDTEHALATLNFFSWDYDQQADPVDEVLKKYALECMRLATENGHNHIGVTASMANREGFFPVDGSSGITLTHVEGFEFDPDDLQVDKKPHKDNL